jgi:hypothetical protein|uniref:Cytochrome c biogenesis FN n=1 Tax=Picea glauca TaxID=3330 RepID=A0A101M0Y0_PICGL|nr:cytochrome c biogenesis FN [Picea glauca]QHR87051.1 putative cytochrome c biogenesis FN [Picea sitchensis]
MHFGAKRASYNNRKYVFLLFRERAHSENKTDLLLHLARDAKDRALFIDEQRIYVAVGIALFFPLFLLVSSNPFVLN